MMTRRWIEIGLLICTALIVSACGMEDDEEPISVDDPSEADGEGVAALGGGEDSLDAVEVTTIADDDEELDGPRDVEFNPEAPEQMWVVNYADNSTVVVLDPGTDEQTHEYFRTTGSDHFLAKPAALAFGDPGFMATAQQEDEETQPTTPEDFMGPVLWPTDLNDYDAGHPSHLDMLHNSPLSSGVAWDEGNAYWIFDGYHGSLTRYDFNEPHPPGGEDHTDGVIERYADGEVGIADEVVAHLDMDHDTDLLYAADTENNRVVTLDTTAGEEGDAISPSYDQCEQRHIDDAELSTVIDGDEFEMTQPAGLELHDDLLFVGDNGTSTIYAFDLEGELVDRLDVSEEIPAGAMMGLAIDEDDRVYAVDSENDAIVRFGPK
ncbi:MAG: hypothetical protein ACOCV2_12580 [Persicimonas sp.]